MSGGKKWICARIGYFLAPQLLLIMTLMQAHADVFQFPVRSYDLSGAPSLTLNKPLTATDRIVATNGHFYTSDGKRTRFWGMNISPHALFPETNEVADRIATHLSKMGINLVRLHALDAAPPTCATGSANCIPEMSLVDPVAGYPNLNNDNLLKLDRLFDAFRAHGIYVHLILRTGSGSIPFPTSMLGSDALEKQQQYASTLINRYKNDPVLATVEIANEESLVAYYWLENTKPFGAADADLLTQKWNTWLYDNFGSDAALQDRWAPESSSVPDPGLRNGNMDGSANTPVPRVDYATGPNWVIPDWYIGDTRPIYDDNGICTSSSLTNEILWTRGIFTGNNELALSLDTMPECKLFYTRLSQKNFNLQVGKSYFLEFEAAAQPERTIGVTIQKYSPSDSVMSPNEFTPGITSAFSTHKYCFTSKYTTVANDYLSFYPWTSSNDMTGALTVRNVKLKPNTGQALLDGEHVSTATTPGTVQRPQAWGGDCPSFTTKRFQDYLAFLVSVERDYYTAMRDHIRSIAPDLPVTGAQVYFGGSHGGLPGNRNLAGLMDFVTANFYWDHPTETPNASWTMQNKSMIDSADDLEGMAAYLSAGRVAGMPLVMTEYSPNNTNKYAEEGCMTMAAYGALQDIDAIIVFDHYAWNNYNHPDSTNFNSVIYNDLMPDRLISWYNVLGESRAASLMHLAANIFRRGDVAAAKNAVTVNVSEAKASAQITQSSTSTVKQSLESITDGVNNYDVRMGLVHRIGISHTETAQETLTPAPTSPFVSDTGELTWNYVSGASRLLLDSQRTKAVGGYMGVNSPLRGMVVTGLGGLGQFGVVGATSADGKPLATSAQILVSAISEGKNANTTYVQIGTRTQLCHDGNGDGVCPPGTNKTYYDTCIDGSNGGIEDGIINLDTECVDKFFYQTDAGPFKIMSNPATIRLDSAASSIRVQRLGPNGQPMLDAQGAVLPDLALSAVDGGGYEFNVGTDGDVTPWYLVTATQPGAYTVEAETAATVSGGSVETDTVASAGQYVLLASNGSVTLGIDDNVPQGKYFIELRAAGQEFNGPPELLTYLNGQPLQTVTLTEALGQSWQYFLASDLPVELPAGTGRTLTIVYQNDLSDRNAMIDSVSFYRADTQPHNSADIALELIASPSGTVLQGSTINYEVRITNNGPASATGVRVSGTLPDCIAGDMVSGATHSCSTDIVAADAGLISQTMTVTSSAFDPDTSNNTRYVSVTVNPSVDLSIAITDSPDPVNQGDTVNYQVTVTNHGPSAATGVTVTGLNGCALSSSSLADGASANCNVGIAAASVSTLTQNLSVSGNEFDPDTADNSASADTKVQGLLTISTTGNGIVTSNPTGINCGSDCTEAYDANTSVSLIATAANDSTFTGWSGVDGAECTTGTVTMTAAKSCAATFTLNSYALTLSTAGTGSGTVTGAGTYNHGSTVTVTATANTGSTFTGWSGTNGAECTTGSVTMTAAKSCTATFTLLTFHNPSANAAQTGGDNNGYQINPSNAYMADTAVAADTNSGSGTGTTCTDSASDSKKDKHLYYNYGYAIPAGATIKGIEVTLNAKVDSTSGAPKICVQLSWDGGVTWTTTKNTSTLTTSLTDYTLGGAADTWGRAWTVTNLSDAGFRVRVIDVASNTSRDFSLNYVGVKVTY